MERCGDPPREFETRVVGKRMRRVVLVLSLVLTVSQLSAQRLAVRSFQIGDGLPHNSVKRIFQDKKGFLWIATWEGLSRFDGYSFKNYGTQHGLGHTFINDITADEVGRLWVATNGGGVSMLVDEPPENSSAERKQFLSFNIVEGGQAAPANFVNRILFDTDNRLWCVTDAGLFRSRETDVVDLGFDQMVAGAQPTHTSAALRDQAGRLWFAVSSDIDRVVRVADGVISAFEIMADDKPAPTEIHTILEDSAGRILAADVNTIYEYSESAADPGRSWKAIDSVKPRNILTMTGASDGGLLIGTDGYMHLSRDRRVLYGHKNGLTIDNVGALSYDREGNLWIGTNGGGLSKLAAEGVVSYTREQGLPGTGVNRIIEDRNGRIYAQIGCSVYEIADDNQFTPLSIAGRFAHRACIFSQIFLQDAARGLWYSTSQGLEYSLEGSADRTLVLDEDGSPVTYTQMYEDAQSNIWLTDDQTGNLYKASAMKGQARAEIVAKNVPAEFIIRDRNSGTVWLANRARLWRIRNGQVDEILSIEGLPVIQPRSLFQDSVGRVWIGTRYHGAVVTEGPDADVPRFRRYTIAEGLASDTIWEIVEDDDQRIYFGTGRGIDQLELESGRIRHFTADEGAIDTSTPHLLKDSRGVIWAATDGGVTRIDPRSLRSDRAAPPIYISEIRVAGEPLAIAETGATEVAPITLAASRNNVSIAFTGLSFRGESSLGYEYKLDGIDTDWVAAGRQREVNYANLGSGDYRFSVRAINSANIPSAQPATFQFRILTPIYLRWWFVALAAFAIGFVSYAFYRNRVQRLLAVERTRTRIATDLHDDIGSDLSKISLLSDLARMKPTENPVERDRMLATIADISRRSVDAMRDIVWAINPQRDSVLEMTRRMRKHAEEIFVDRDVKVSFEAPAEGGNARLPMDVRRELYLIFKEAVNNAARHSGCASVTIGFSVERNNATLTVTDDGKGFDTTLSVDGNGLANMRKRAIGLGGKFNVSTNEGTRVEVVVPTDR